MVETRGQCRGIFSLVHVVPRGCLDHRHIGDLTDLLLEDGTCLLPVCLEEEDTEYQSGWGSPREGEQRRWKPFTLQQEQNRKD